MTDIQFNNFNSATGILDGMYIGRRFSINVPIEDGVFIEGNTLLEYIRGLLSASVPVDLSAVKGADSIHALCTSSAYAAPAPTYVELRALSYPSPALYLDAVVKGDIEAQQSYIDKCLAVKARFPKPIPELVSDEVLKTRREL